MNDDELRKAYQARRQPPAAPPSPEELARLVSGEGTEQERVEVLDRALSTPEGARDLELLRAISHAGRQDAQPRWWRAPGPLAVAASLLVVLAVGVLSRRAPGPGETRGTPGADAPVLLQPADGARTAAPVRFAWRSVTGARAYRVELLTDAGTLVTSIETPDTTTAYAGAPTTRGDSAYRWLVVALFPEGGEVASRPRRLTLTAP